MCVAASHCSYVFCAEKAGLSLTGHDRPLVEQLQYGVLDHAIIDFLLGTGCAKDRLDDCVRTVCEQCA